MRRHWSKWLAIIASMGLVGLAIVSYQRFFVGEYFLTKNAWYQIIVRDGNLGLVRVAASFSEDRPEDFDLEDHVLGWRRVPIASKWRWLNRVTNPMPSISLRENEFNCTMYAVASLPLWLVFVAMPCWRNRRLARPLLREIIRPSDRSIEPRPLRRKVKRLAIAIAFIVFWLSGYGWAFDYPSLASQTIQFTNAGVPTRLTIPSTPGAMVDTTDEGLEMNAFGGSINIGYSIELDDKNTNAGWIVDRFGFRLAYQYDWAAAIRGRFASATFAGTGLSLPKNRETSITIPLWLPTALCLLIVMISFLRGPWMRHKRVIENRCLRCGYNLTGLIEPRCPECGTGFDVTAKRNRPD